MTATLDGHRLAEPADAFGPGRPRRRRGVASILARLRRLGSAEPPNISSPQAPTSLATQYAHGTPLDAATGAGTRQANVIGWLRELGARSVEGHDD